MYRNVKRLHVASRRGPRNWRSTHVVPIRHSRRVSIGRRVGISRGVGVSRRVGVVSNLVVRQLVLLEVCWQASSLRLDEMYFIKVIRSGVPTAFALHDIRVRGRFGPADRLAFTVRLELVGVMALLHGRRVRVAALCEHGLWSVEEAAIEVTEGREGGTENEQNILDDGPEEERHVSPYATKVSARFLYEDLCLFGRTHTVGPFVLARSNPRLWWPCSTRKPQRLDLRPE